MEAEISSTAVRKALEAVDNLVHANFSLPIEQETKGYVAADEATYALKDALIKQHSYTIGRLAGIPIKILMAKKSKTSKGRKVLGSAKLFRERDRLLHPYRFLIVLDAWFWLERPEKREALLFHELCHCSVDERGDCSIAHHDLEEFFEVVKHYGMWKQDIEHFSEQLSLFSSQPNAPSRRDGA